MKITAFACIALCTLCACSSSQKKLDVQKNYKVVDRDPDPVPGWVEDLSDYQDSQKGYVFYIGESGPVSDRIAGCEEAKMRGNEKIASEIATYIDNKVASFNGGQLHVDENNPDNPGMESHFAQLLKSEAMAMLHGVKEQGHFWEKRQNTDTQNYYYECSMLMRISQKDLDRLIQRAAHKAPDLVENPDAKKEVMDAIHGMNGSDFHPNNM